MKIQLPPILAIDKRCAGNKIQQLLLPSNSTDVSVESYRKNRAKGYVFVPEGNTEEQILLLTNGAQPPNGFAKILRLITKDQTLHEQASLNLENAKWMKHPKLSSRTVHSGNYADLLQEVVDSWQGTFVFKEEDLENEVEGLRSPQLGAVHGVHAHWSADDQVATIVLPTGVGKTETMLSVLLSKQCSKVLVIVPTDVLRTQIADKFSSLGILKDFGIVSEKALHPVVGYMKHKPKSVEEVDALFEKCNVIVSTMSIAGRCSDEVQRRMAHHCPFLFVDEAHHVAAKTWHIFRQKFSERRVLQFTATPFRNDNRPVDGKVIFNYPIRKAQEEGYFRPIQFRPVREFDPARADTAIAEMAVEQLREDRANGHNHILMARVGSIERAKDVFALYEDYSEFDPVQIHSGIKSKRERDEIRRKVQSGEAKIVVCVDMLGEGFDLPELKIAAFHDIRKSLAITLQLAGRFTRTKPDLGEATFIANIADVNVREELSEFYAQGADWNTLLSRGSEEAVQEQVGLWDFVNGFDNFPDRIPLQNLQPALSSVIYKTTCQEWTPENFEKGLSGASSLDRLIHDVNHHKNTLVIVTGKKTPIGWAQIRDIHDWTWELYVLFWDKEQNLLFINSSGNSGYYKQLAEAVAGEVELVEGPPVFRCFSEVNRLKLQNVGLREQLGRLIRYTMRAGSDVEPGLSEAQRRNTVKSNIFGIGYENGSKTSVGCSYKGRIWSRKVANVEALTRWCSALGAKVTDETVDPEEVLRGTLVPTPVSERPTSMPIGVEWPEIVYREPEISYTFVIDGTEIPLYQCDIRLVEPTEDGELRFEIGSETVKSEFILSLFEREGIKEYSFSTTDSTETLIKYGSRISKLEEHFREYPPTIWFVDGSSLEGNSYTELNRTFDPYPRQEIEDWDWVGIDLKIESQRVAKITTSIQHHVISELKNRDYEIIFDDDGAGEAADVVTVRSSEESIEVEFYHCKYSSEKLAGGRIKDLYEVCGQAQKCIHWKEKPRDLFSHLLRREPKREKGQQASRFERGNENDLFQFREMSRVIPINLSIFIVQPGLSKAAATDDQLELLSVTENYLMETFKLSFGVIASQ